ncbi:alpha-hydroxy acid oxidase [Bosea sp. 2YAB26]|uniref:alpha-hydroxy acid oxidase n=1 Tax=Bosea sp. 2YAB26 TaxID=3237478 RepID=UPI003F8DACE9
MHALKVAPRNRRRAIDRSAGLAGLDAGVRRMLPPALYHYLAGASDDEATHARNLRAFGELAFLPKVLVDVSRRSLAKTLFGVERPLPFGIAPMGLSRLIAPDGDIALARAAADADIPFILSGASLTAMEEVRAAGATSWFQAYIPGEADRIARLIDRVEAAGFDTLVITADTAVHPKHERAARHGFHSPVKPSLGLAWQGLSRPGWLRRVLLRDRLAALKFRFENMDAEQGPPVFSANLVRDIGRRDALSWPHIEAVRRRWKGKLVIKGIMAAGDAAVAEKAGVDGIIVSNHGGRQVDCAASSLAALERIAERGLRLTVMHDGGIRRGADVLKALKLGADFVFVGRPMLMAAAIGGQRGAAEAIALLAEEIDIAMALLGIDDLPGLAEVELLRDRRPLS